MSATAVRVIAFCAGFVGSFMLEIALLAGWQWLMGGDWRPVGLGWAVFPVIGGLGCAARAREWLAEIERRKTVLRSRRERGLQLGPGHYGNPVKGLKPPPGREWIIVDTWPPSDIAGTQPQMVREAVRHPSESSPLFPAKEEKASGNEHT